MATTFVNAVQVQNKTGSSFSTFNLPAFNCGSNNLIVVGIAAGNASSVTDTAGNTYVEATNLSVSGRGDAEVWYCLKSNSNASNVITVNFSPNGAYLGLCASQYTNGGSAGFVRDIVASGQNASTNSISTSSFTTTVADEVIVAYATQATAGATFTPGSGYTIRCVTGDGTDAIEDKIVTSIQTSVVATMNSSLTFGFGIIAVSFYDANPNYIMTCTTGVFTLTGNAVNLSKGYVMQVATGVFNMVGNAVNLVVGGQIWTNIAKSVTSWTNGTKSSTTWDNEDKSSTTWTNQNKS